MHSPGQIIGGNALPRGAIAAAWDWWHGAGVDCAFADEPASWLAEAAPELTAEVEQSATPPTPVVPVAQPRAQIGGAAQGWPQTAEDFAGWWIAEPSLDNGHIEGRIAPRGKAGARLMVLVDHPEPEDSDRLLSGPQGKMLDAILRALGLADSDVYVASALPRPMPMPDWAALAADGLDELTAHHVALARPQRLLVFGSNVSSLLGHDPANSDGFLPGIHHEGARIPALVAPGLAALAARPRGKARLWQALLDWTGADWIGTEA
ncbi:MAG: hypothetical protein ACKOQ3_10865 [Novosphingobium sp.]